MEGLFAVTLYQVSVAVHVMVAIVAFGPTFAYPLIQITAERAFPSNFRSRGRSSAGWTATW